VIEIWNRFETIKKISIRFTRNHSYLYPPLEEKANHKVIHLKRWLLAFGLVFYFSDDELGLVEHFVLKSSFIILIFSCASFSNVYPFSCKFEPLLTLSPEAANMYIKILFLIRRYIFTNQTFCLKQALNILINLTVEKKILLSNLLLQLFSWLGIFLWFCSRSRKTLSISSKTFDAKNFGELSNNLRSFSGFKLNSQWKLYFL